MLEGRILNNFIPAIILMIFVWMLNTLILCVEFPQKITPYDMMEWK
jgi:hypothetical protein